MNMEWDRLGSARFRILLIEFCDGVIRGCVERSAGVGIKGNGG